VIEAQTIVSALLDNNENFKAFMARQLPATSTKASGLWILRNLDQGIYLHGSVYRDTHHYSHSRSVSMDLNVEIDPEFEEKFGEKKIDNAVQRLKSEMEEHIVDLGDSFYRLLEKEYDYATSDEAIIESLDANEWYFNPETGEEVDVVSGLDVQQLKPDIQKKVIAGFKDLVMRDDNAVLIYLHDKGIRFLPTGAVAPKPEGVKISEIEDKSLVQTILDKHRDYNVQDEYWYEGTIEWCKTYLEAMGFNNPEVNFSGFSSQGDGASFTCKSIDFKKYIEKAIISPIEMKDV
jgi:hypothetical protein